MSVDTLRQEVNQVTRRYSKCPILSPGTQYSEEHIAPEHLRLTRGMPEHMRPVKPDGKSLSEGGKNDSINDEIFEKWRSGVKRKIIQTQYSISKRKLDYIIKKGKKKLEGSQPSWHSTDDQKVF